MKRTVYISLCTLLFFMGTIQNGKCVMCPDLVCTSFNIEKIRTNKNINNAIDIQYGYTIKNIGSDTLFLKNVAIQNYISGDSSYLHGVAAGGAYIAYNSTNYLLPDSTYSSSYVATTYQSLITYPFLFVNFQVLNQTDCNLVDNWVLKKVDLLSNGCPDLICTSLTVTDTSAQSTFTYIYYKYTIKNIGTDTLFLKEIIAQSYVSKDSAYGSNLSPAGGAYIALNSKNYLLPDSFYSASYGSSSSQSLATYPYLIVNFYFTAPIECTSDINLGIARIKEEVITSLDNAQSRESKIIWIPGSKTLTINGGNSAVINKYKIYNTYGKVIISGSLKNNESKVISLAPGIYIIEAISANKHIIKKILVE